VGPSAHCKSRGLYLLLEKEKNHQFGHRFFFLVHCRMVLAVKRVQFVHGSMSHIVL
jgi:hypothetical protein